MVQLFTKKMQLKQKLQGIKRRVNALDLTTLNQAKLNSAVSWLQRSKAGNVILNLQSLSVLTSVKVLKRAKAKLSSSTQLVANTQQQQLTDLSFSKEKPRVCVVAEASIPQCLHYRVMQKVEQLTGIGCHVEWIDWSELSNAHQRLYVNDIVIIYRLPGLPKVQQFIQQAKRLNKLVIYDVDDLIFDRNELDKKFTSTTAELNDADIQGILNGADLFKSAMQLCDYGLASTTALQNEVAKHVAKKKAFLLPNGLDENIESLSNAVIAKPQGDEVTIFYGSGTKTHDADFAVIAKPLAKVLSENESVKLVIAGYLELPVQFDSLRSQIQRLPLLDFNSYLRCLQHADIAIAPLELGKFADCKSEIKWLEAAHFAVPSVVSATACYQEVVSHGDTGYLASNESEWYESLLNLVVDAELRKTIGLAAKERATTEYSSIQMQNKMTSLLIDIQQEAINDGIMLPALNAEKQHILFVNVLYPPHAVGGATTVVSDTVRELNSSYGEQFHISVLTTEMNDDAPYSYRQYDQDGVSVTVLGIPLSQDLELRAKDDFVLRACKETYQQISPDLIHFHCIQRLTGSCVEAARSENIPYIVSVHDAWWLSEHQFLLDSKDRLVNTLQANPFTVLKTAQNTSSALSRFQYLSEQLQGAKTIIAVSDFQKNLYNSNGFENVVTVRNGVSVIDTSKESTSRHSGDKLVIAYLGGVSAHKGYYFLREIIEKNTWSNLHFKMIDLFKPEGYEHTEQCGSSKLSHVGKMSSSTVATFYDQINALIAPSIWPESFGLVTREAALHGAWVVAADAGGMAEDIVEGETGFVFSMGSEEQCTAILSDLNKNYEHYRDTLPSVELSQSKINSLADSIKGLAGLYLNK